MGVVGLLCGWWNMGVKSFYFNSLFLYYGSIFGWIGLCFWGIGFVYWYENVFIIEYKWGVFGCGLFLCVCVF